MSHERLKNSRVIKSRTEPNFLNRATLLQNVTELLHEIDHYLKQYPPESDFHKTSAERLRNAGSQDCSSDSDSAASPSCNIENINVANTLIPSSLDGRTVDESGGTSGIGYPHNGSRSHQQDVVPSNSDAIMFHQVVEEFSRIWACLRLNKGSDVCYIHDKVGNGRLYIINDLAYSLTCVSLNEQQLHIIKRNRAAFQSAICSKDISKKEFALLLEWQEHISQPTPTNEASNEIVWNDIKYKRENDNYHYKADAFERSSPIWPMEPCKSYFKNGVCSNHNCLSLHDPTNALWCKRFFTNFKSSVSQLSFTHSKKDNEYTTPICELNLSGMCPYPTGVESGELGGNICQYWHGAKTMSTYPICRRFAHTGFCYRGSLCKFKHLKKCPDNNMGAPCIYEDCIFSHPDVTRFTIPKKDTKVTRLSDIPGTDYMITPTIDEKSINSKDFTFHGTSVQDDVGQHGPSIMHLATKNTSESLTTASENVATNTRANSEEEDILNADFISL